MISLLFEKGVLAVDSTSLLGQPVVLAQVGVDFGQFDGGVERVDPGVPLGGGVVLGGGSVIGVAGCCDLRGRLQEAAESVAPAAAVITLP